MYKAATNIFVCLLMDTCSHVSGKYPEVELLIGVYVTLEEPARFPSDSIITCPPQQRMRVLVAAHSRQCLPLSFFRTLAIRMGVE